MERRWSPAGLIALVSWTLAGCATTPDDAPILVLAASSLTESLQTVAAAWTAKGNPTVTFSFDASSRLARQIEAGAPADLFVSADPVWVTELHGKGLVTQSADLLGNSLVLIVPRGTAVQPKGVSDLAGVQHLALAADNAPAGTYARAALGQLGAWEAVKDRVVTGDNVRTVLGWVATGEADAGVVYGTDAKVEPRVTEAFTFPADSHPPIVYAAALLAGHAQQAPAFLTYCQSAEGMAVFNAAGFTQRLLPY